MAKIILPDDRELAHRVIDQQAIVETRRADQGLYGLLGDVKHKPSNIAFIVIALSFAFMLILLFTPDSDQMPKNQLFTSAWVTVTSALGFLFGRATKT